MAIFRKIHTSFWSDSFVSDLDRDKKLFYLYLLTNERTRQCGVYEITKKQISFDLGYSIDTVSKLLEYFIKIGKIRYNDTTKELAIGNWLKFNSSTSPKVKTCIDKEFQSVKDTVLIQYVKSMDTQSQEEEEQEEEEESKENVHTLLPSADLSIPQSEIDRFNHYLSWAAENCPKLLKIAKPLTAKQLSDIRSKYSSEQLKDVCLAMEAKKDFLKKYDNLNLTMRSWLKRQFGEGGNSEIPQKTPLQKGIEMPKLVTPVVNFEDAI